jgi:hypothetical protein
MPCRLVEGAGSRLFLNVGTFVLDHMALHARRRWSAIPPTWSLQGLIICVAVGTSNCFLHSVLQICGFCGRSTKNESSSTCGGSNSICKHSWGYGIYRTCSQSSSQFPWDLALANAWSRVGSPVGYYHNTFVFVISTIAVGEISLKVAFINFISWKFSHKNCYGHFKNRKCNSCLWFYYAS